MQTSATITNQDNIKRGADAVRPGQQMVSLKASEAKAALSALAVVDDDANKSLDIDSMMTALEDCLQKAAEGNSGVPINYYLKEFTKDMLAEIWVAKYTPENYMRIQGDDDETKED
jgi:hypothetical protein